MPGQTTVLDREKENRIRAFMGSAQGDEDYNAVIDGVFAVDEDTGKEFRHRITIKDYQVTGSPSQESVATEAEFEKLTREKALPEWLLKRMGAFYSNEYIVIKRREHMAAILEQLQNMESSLDDRESLAMHTQLFLNEIYVIYRKFVKTRQDENFLAVVNLLEEIFRNNEINKKIIKESKAALKAIKDVDKIEYGFYKCMAKRFFEVGADLISIRENTNDR